MKLKNYLIAFVALALSMATVSAQSVKSVTPPASYKNAAGQTVQITIGTIVPSGAEITTGAGGSVGITLPSGASVVINESATVTITGGITVDIAAGTAVVTTSTKPISVVTRGAKATVPSNTKVTGKSTSSTEGNITVDQGTQNVNITTVNPDGSEGPSTSTPPIILAPAIPATPPVVPDPPSPPSSPA